MMAMIMVRTVVANQIMELTSIIDTIMSQHPIAIQLAMTAWPIRIAVTDI